MEIYKIAKGMIGSNTYLLVDNNEAAIIDPGSELKEVEKIIDDNKINIKYIILTHAHIDHILYLDDYREKYKTTKVATYDKESLALSDPNANGAKLFGKLNFYKEADMIVKEGDVLEIGDTKLEIIHTPGHTNGSLSVYCREEKVLFTGDTLFKEQIGRTDFPRGDFESMQKSLAKLMTYPEDVKVCPGHGVDSTIEHEKNMNPFIY